MMPDMPDTDIARVRAAYETITRCANEMMTAAAQLAAELGVPEALQSPEFEKTREHLDLAVGFYAHRFVTVRVPNAWGRANMPPSAPESQAPNLTVIPDAPASHGCE